LEGARTRTGSKLGALLAALLACAGALAADNALAAKPAGSKRASACAGANLQPSAANVPAIDAALLCLVNQVRRAHGLRPLRPNRELRGVAASQVSSMVRQNYFADIRPSGQTPLSLVAVTRYPVHAEQFAVAENIAWGTGSDATPAHIVAAWMASPPHREIMLGGEYRDIGVGVTLDVPAVLRAGGLGATYAIELGVRRF
jgi:uncharacterized protein YkwD